VRWHWWTLGAIILGVLAAWWAGAPTQAAGNLLTNGGFEDGASGWTGISAIVATPVHAGSKAAALACSVACQIRQSVAAEPASSYVLTAYLWKNSSSASSAWLSVSWLRADGATLGVIESARLSAPDPSYRVLTLNTLAAPAGAAYASIALRLAGQFGGSPATVYFDDVSFLRVAGPTETFTPTRTATATVTRTATTPAYHTPTRTRTPPATDTPSPTASITQTATETETATATSTETGTPSPTASPFASRLPLILK